MAIKQPMLSAKFDKDPEVALAQMKALRFPVLASPKLDGIRAHISDGVVLSRKNKPIPNQHVQNLFMGGSYLDGELIVGSETSSDCFNRTSSGVMSEDGEPDVTYHVFDSTKSMTMPFISRLAQAESVSLFLGTKKVRAVEHKFIYSLDELFAYEEEKVLLGHEGIMIRDPSGQYKQGRSTLREGWLIKMKRFEPGEATILGVYEQETNLNEATTNEVGRSKRSSHKANKIPNGHLGGFHVVDIETGVEFNIGNFDGVTKDQRKLMWENTQKMPSIYNGKTIRYKYFPVGVKEKPRHPTFLGFRED